jgi:hypothetical protein
MSTKMPWEGLLFRAFDLGASSTLTLAKGATVYLTLKACFEGLVNRKLLTPLIHFHACQPVVRVLRPGISGSPIVFIQESVQGWPIVPREQLEELIMGAREAMNDHLVTMVERRLEGNREEAHNGWRKKTELLVERLERAMSQKYTKRELVEQMRFESSSRFRRSGGSSSTRPDRKGC